MVIQLSSDSKKKKKKKNLLTSARKIIQSLGYNYFLCFFPFVTQLFHSLIMKKGKLFYLLVSIELSFLPNKVFRCSSITEMNEPYFPQRPS